MSKADELPSIDFIPNDDFATADVDEMLYLTSGSIYADRDEQTALELDACGDFEVLGNLPLLSPNGEAFLFRKYNYLRWCAEQARTKGSKKAIKESQQYVRDANTVRNHIAECNLRLVISIARKFSNSHSDFDELMSEGNEILLKAITKFDFSRGYRFSTYATHSVQRHFYRYIQRRSKRNALEFRSDVELLNELPETDMDPLMAEWISEQERMQELIAHLGDRLDERERIVVIGRYGLANDGVMKTLRELAADMGLSKERVRQLQMSALEKLRDFFDEIRPELYRATSKNNQAVG